MPLFSHIINFVVITTSLLRRYFNLYMLLSILEFGQQTYRLNMACPGELIMSDSPGHDVSILLKYLKVSCKACGLAGNIDDVWYAVADDLGKCLGVDSVAGRIEDNKIGFFFNLIKDFQHIARDEMAIIKMIELCVLFGSLNSFLDNLDTDNLVGNRCKKLSNRTCSGIQIEDNPVILP